jgi:hypothetical protein
VIGCAARIVEVSTGLLSPSLAAPLTELRGGPLTAAKILARVGNVHRFCSGAAFDSVTGQVLGTGRPGLA